MIAFYRSAQSPGLYKHTLNAVSKQKSNDKQPQTSAQHFVIRLLVISLLVIKSLQPLRRMAHACQSLSFKHVPVLCAVSMLSFCCMQKALSRDDVP